MITLLKLHYFLETAKAASFTEAAQRLYTTQPNISKQIALLEKELGTELFYRVKGQVQLTKAGQYLYDELKNLPDKVEETCLKAAAIGREDKRHLSVGVFKKAAGYNIHMALLQFAAQNPGLSFDIEREDYDWLCSGFLESKYDMIITDEAELPVYRGMFTKQKLFDMPMALAVSTESKWADSEQVSLSQLKKEPFIIRVPKRSGFCSDQLQSLFREAGFAPVVSRYVYSLENLFVYTALNEGVTVIEANNGRISSPGLKLVKLEPPVSLPVYALWSDRHGQDLPQRIVDWLVESHPEA